MTYLLFLAFLFHQDAHIVTSHIPDHRCYPTRQESTLRGTHNIAQHLPANNRQRHYGGCHSHTNLIQHSWYGFKFCKSTNKPNQEMVIYIYIYIITVLRNIGTYMTELIYVGMLDVYQRRIVDREYCQNIHTWTTTAVLIHWIMFSVISTVQNGINSIRATSTAEKRSWDHVLVNKISYLSIVFTQHPSSLDLLIYRERKDVPMITRSTTTLAFSELPHRHMITISSFHLKALVIKRHQESKKVQITNYAAHI